MKKYKLKHDTTVLGVPTMGTTDCWKITDSGMGLGKGMILYGIPVKRNRLGQGMKDFVQIAMPTHTGGNVGKELLGMYVPASAAQEIADVKPTPNESTSSADGGIVITKAPTKLLGLRVSTAFIGVGLAAGTITTISSYYKFKNMDWENMSSGEQGTAVGKTLGSLAGSLITIGIGYAVLLYDDNK